MNTGDILVVEDDPRFLKLYRDVLETAGYTATLKKDPESGIQALKTKFPDLVLLDLTFNGADQGGMDFIVEALRYKPDISIIVISAHDESSTIMKAMDLGAVDYIVKDQSLYEFLPIRVGQTLKRTRLEKQIRSQWELHHGFAFGSEKIIIGKSPQMFQVFQLIEQAAASRSTTLIIGESGTGKELVAQAIHARKGQLSGPFVSIDCGAIPKTVLESELFGVRAKYPGFHNADRLVGKFEAAEDGTILLDEIGNMEVDLQAKLLRVLEERQFSPLGAPQPTHLRAQVVASTNIRFDEAIQSGRFREDVYYRLNNIQIVVPPLRDRKEDIPLLVQYFLDRFKRQSGNSTEILPEALEKLVAHDWPGNVRELSRVMQRALTANQSRYLIPKNFDFNSASGIKSEVVGEQQAYIPTKNAGVSYKILVREYQKSILVSALKENDWNQTKAAEQLQISRTYLLMLLKNLKISGPKPETF
ncbi:MAG: sigma-54 dependent transcriptional regulator (plasmid) [Candidatus Manganitrophus sp.]|nr:sigma-54 dependent transcriptional regulator [Candidatus Manganitrophus sp.]MDC4228150.1 sigma-54 dependent transcriptional regulator [Candidatus Manganitrophus sp.]WDT73599.1 MAG: sigma-54 dependent transcriptional regulator [Candidatus Manganitrophus sp.]WDT82896.1 MAG: sigma-54 dependent transcriptional regulator [Candidatus Manganitrophus sp.]